MILSSIYPRYASENQHTPGFALLLNGLVASSITEEHKKHGKVEEEAAEIKAVRASVCWEAGRGVGGGGRGYRERVKSRLTQDN